VATEDPSRTLTFPFPPAQVEATTSRRELAVKGFAALAAVAAVRPEPVSPRPAVKGFAALAAVAAVRPEPVSPRPVQEADRIVPAKSSSIHISSRA